MFAPTQIAGSQLPDKTLSFTFDDGPGFSVGEGPGPKTLRLAEFLNAENIRATFFCVGQHIELYPEILPKLDQLGHFVGAHTYSHPHMLELFEAGKQAEILEEMIRTELLINNILPGKPIYFRAPYGEWSAEISGFLNREFKTADQYIGPYYWEMNANDWDFWDRHLSAADCATAYLSLVESVRRGIFLMHDSTANIDNMRLNNLTFETIQILIPVLKSRGYSFVGIDQLPVQK